MQARKFLEGRWSLESFEVYPPGKAAYHLKGAGTLTYDEFGNLRMEIRTDRDAADLLRSAGIDIRDDGMISSDGRTPSTAKPHADVHDSRASRPPGCPLATNRPRHWEVEGNVLTLTTRTTPARRCQLAGGIRLRRAGLPSTRGIGR